MKKDIAIVGISARYAQSNSLQEFWTHLLEEKELIHFFSKEELEEKRPGSKLMEQANYVGAAGTVQTANTFDYAFFDYTLDEAKIMNPQTRLMHQLVWEALEDAGCDVERYTKKVGIFLGANRDLNWALHAELTDNLQVDNLYKTKIANPNFMASLISYKFNFRGPCYFLDTACSTSLSTAHLACRSLLLKECSLAVVGGIRLLSREDYGYLHQEGSIMSRDGHNRSFDSEASGTVATDGAGVVILKRLEDALKTRDHIYAVIKGSAMNNDGNAKAGYTVPSVEGQLECIRLAQRIADVSPQDISYVEAHGTGTRIGDPIEIAALNLAFNNDTRHQCAVGSIKSNLGHTDEAAGVSGLIKTAMALKDKVLPASLHFSRSNPRISFDEGPFYVVDRTRKWDVSAGQPRLAGINSMGIGGTNVHMILQEPPEISPQTDTSGPKLILYSARTQEALCRYEGQLLHFLENHRDTCLSDMAYTLQLGRKQMDYCRFTVAENIEELIEFLQLKQKDVKPIRRKRFITFMFSGQGSQYSRMGKGLYDRFPSFRATMDWGFSLMKDLTGIDIEPILFNTHEGEKLDDTLYTQPALFLLEYSLARLLQHLGITPDFTIGHSLGEYVAATLSGVFEPEDALRIVIGRAHLMSEVDKGEMLSIRKPLDEVDLSCLEQLNIAAINAKDSFVVSGTPATIAKARAYLRSIDVAFLPLNTSHAFHSSMMDEILDDFRKLFDGITLSEPQVPFISNITGTFITNDEATSVDYWANHIVDTVQFAEGIRTLSAKNQCLFIEVGPGRTLVNICRKAQDFGLENSMINTLRHSEEAIDDNTFFHRFLGQLWINGFNLNWEHYYAGDLPRKIVLPTYSFAAYHLPTKVNLDDQISQRDNWNPDENSIVNAGFVPSFKYLPSVVSTKEAVSPDQKCLVFMDDSVFGRKLVQQLRAQGNEIIEVENSESFTVEHDGRIRINPGHVDDFQQLFAYLDVIKFNFSLLIIAWGLAKDCPEKTSYSYHDYNVGYLHLQAIIKALDAYDNSTSVKLVLLSHRGAGFDGVRTTGYPVAHEGTLLRVATQENEHLSALLLDVNAEDFVDKDIKEVIRECASTTPYQLVALRNGRRWISCYEPVSLPVSEDAKLPFKTEGAYLITGELDKLTTTISTYLLSEYRARVLCLALDTECHCDIHTDQQTLNRLHALPGTFTHDRVSVYDLEGIAAQITSFERQHGAVHGVVHMAKNEKTDQMSLARDINEEMVEKHFAPRVEGLLAISQSFKDRKPSFVKVISSLSSCLGGISYGAYGAAAALMNEVALSFSQREPGWSVLNLDHIQDEEPWISTDEFLTVFKNSFVTNIDHLIISKRDLEDPDALVPKKQSNLENRVNIDRNQLNSDFQQPQSAAETYVVNLFESLFGVEGVGAEDDFFELGGDSLKALVFINRIKKSRNITLTVADIFAHTTARGLAELIERRKHLPEDSPKKNELII